MMPGASRDIETAKSLNFDKDSEMIDSLKAFAESLGKEYGGFPEQ